MKNTEPHSKLNMFAQIRSLSKSSAILLCSALIQRMLPNYLLFCELTDFSDANRNAQWPDVAKNLVNLLWEVSTNKAMKLNVDVQMEKLEEITPDVQLYDNLGAYAALDFCMALHASYQLISNEEPNEAVTVAKLSQGSVERHIMGLEDKELTGAELKAHPLMQYEIDSLKALFDFCEQKGIQSQDIKALRKDIIDSGVSSLGIEF
uniref:YjaG family protein n=1 Tax=Ningiella ruwaisensis TaxID=2364274 RepID=UPI00109FC498|nr:YjaG family protein [Ningiella ruwaisensis]